MRLLAVILFLGLLAGAPSRASAASCSHADLVFYSNNSVLLAQRLHGAPSACADYFISVTPATGGGPRAGVASSIRSNGPQFHAMPELRLSDWAAYAALNGDDWYAAGVHVRDLMVTAGFDVSKGDIWAINEVGSPSGAQMATDVFNNVDDSRLHLEQLSKASTPASLECRRRQGWSARAAKASRASDSAGRAATTRSPRASPRRTASCHTVVLPMPGSPTTSSAASDGSASPRSSSTTANSGPRPTRTVTDGAYAARRRCSGAAVQ